MYASHRQLLTQDSPSWTWYLTPMLVVAAMGALLLPLGPGAAEATAALSAAEAVHAEAPEVARWLVPSPQPGEGEAEILVADLPQCC